MSVVDGVGDELIVGDSVVVTEPDGVIVGVLDGVKEVVQGLPLIRGKSQKKKKKKLVRSYSWLFLAICGYSWQFVVTKSLMVYVKI